MSLPRDLTVTAVSLTKILILAKKLYEAGDWAVGPSDPSVVIPMAEVLVSPLLQAGLISLFSRSLITVTENGVAVDPSNLTPFPVVDNDTRPDPTTVPVGTLVWNTVDNAVNGSDGTLWRDAMGALT